MSTLKNLKYWNLQHKKENVLNPIIDIPKSSPFFDKFLTIVITYTPEVYLRGKFLHGAIIITQKYKTKVPEIVSVCGMAKRIFSALK